MYFRLMGKLNARRNNLQQENEKGFTLIELLVVVIIIGILAAIAIPVYIGVQNNAKDNAVKSDLTNVKTAIVAYQTDPTTSGTPLATGDSLATKLASYVTIDDSNYKTPSTDEPALVKVGSDGSFCVSATSKTSHKFWVTDTVAPTSTEPAACTSTP